MTGMRIAGAGAVAATLVLAAVVGCTDQRTGGQRPGKVEDERASSHDMDMRAGEGLHGDFAHSELVVLDNPVDVPGEFTDHLEALYGLYRELAQAFVGDDAARADRVADRMREAIEGIDPSGLGPDAAHAWQGHERVMRTSLHQMTLAAGIEEKREHFSHLSEAMYCALRSFGGLDHPVYAAYCPMAANGRGAYWLADDSEISNPYMGSKGSRCGEVKEVIE